MRNLFLFSLLLSTEIFNFAACANFPSGGESMCPWWSSSMCQIYQVCKLSLSSNQSKDLACVASIFYQTKNAFHFRRENFAKNAAFSSAASRKSSRSIGRCDFDWSPTERAKVRKSQTKANIKMARLGDDFIAKLCFPLSINTVIRDLGQFPIYYNQAKSRGGRYLLCSFSSLECSFSAGGTS
jgi:hypothetical protein